MFKNATVLGFNPKARLTDIPETFHFVPPLTLELQRDGWSPVRDGQFIYRNNGHLLLTYTVEKKHLPAGAVKLAVAERRATIEAGLEFSMGKKALKDLTERVRDELLPRALSSRSSIRVWVDPEAGRVVIDSASNATVDAVVRLLIRTFDGIGLQDTTWPREKVVTEWVLDPPLDFTADDAVALVYPGEKRTTVKFDKANLNTSDVIEHLRKGATAQALAMTYDAKISFVMTADLQLRRIRMLDILKEGAEAAKDVDKFDNDFVLMTGELGRLFDAIAKEA